MTSAPPVVYSSAGMIVGGLATLVVGAFTFVWACAQWVVERSTDAQGLLVLALLGSAVGLLVLLIGVWSMAKNVERSTQALLPSPSSVDSDAVG